MSRNTEELNQRSHSDLFRTLVTDSKLTYLGHALRQHEQAQEHLHHNEEQQRQLRQYMEYNHLRILELDIARQRILNLNSKNEPHACGVDDSTVPGMSTNSLKPPDISGTKTQGSVKPRSTSKNLLPLQRPSNPNGNSKSSGLQQHAATEILLSLQREPSLVDMHSSTQYAGHPTTVEDGIQQQEIHVDGAENHLHMYPLAKVARPPWIEKEYTDDDVLCERGNFSYNHPGNKAYRTFVKSLQDQYVSSKKNDKVAITTRVFDYITKTCGGRFLGHDEEGGGRWKELSEDEVRRKIGQSLREKNKRFVPSPRKRFVSDLISGYNGTDSMDMERANLGRVHHPI